MTNGRKLISITAMLGSLGLTLAACSGGGYDQAASGQSGSASGGDSIEVFASMPAGSPQEAALAEVTSRCEQSEGIKVDLLTGSSAFEDDMKVRMASGNIPDVFTTHGWSVMRYSPILRTLEDQEWAQYVNPSLDTVMLDEEGHLYALPLEYGLAGLVTNFDVLEEAGVDPDSISDWASFDAALEKISASGVHPIVVSPEGAAGNLGNFMASGQFTPEELDQFASGTFDVKAWERGVSGHIQDWADKGYFNPDYVSASGDDMARRLAEGEAAFIFEWPHAAATALEYNPEAKIGFIPYPSDLERYLSGGEGVSAFGIWKDTPNEEAALKYLACLATPENAEYFLGAQGVYSGLTNVSVDLGELTQYYDRYAGEDSDVPVHPVFDRVYLPSGMWNTIITTTDALINKQSDAQQAAQNMADQFNTLYGQETD